jgi:predicted acyltransferase
MKERLASLDVFRGVTIASMMIVNNPGSWNAVYAPLEHAEWNGWTFTDTVFPFFLWIVGVAMTFSVTKRAHPLLHVFRRAALIFLLGLLLNGFPRYNLETLRIPGVLQRIAVCYLIAGVIYLYTGWRGQLALCAFFLVLYAVLMGGVYEKDHNFARWVDSQVLTGHMWRQTKDWDPEGVISTLPAISTCLFGVLTGYIVRSARGAAEKTAWLFTQGVALVALGHVLTAWIPINKSLWTSSYSVFMAGLASVEFALFYWLVDVQGWKRWTKPAAIYGMNAILVYALAGILARLVPARPLLTAILNPYNASLLYAICFMLVLYGIAYVMYRRNWFLRL